MNNRLSKLEAADFINRSQTTLARRYGDELVKAAKRDSRIVCLTADLSPPTETDVFRDTFPDRFHNVGIAEANMIGIAGGMARSGEIPFVHSFCAFITKRCFDQITMQVAYPNLPVKIVGFLPGIATLLGVSHQANEDIALMRAVPNMTVLEPSGPEYHASAVRAALQCKGPVYLRMKRPETAPMGDFKEKSLSIGRGILCRKGSDATIIAAGLMVEQSLVAANTLANDGIDVAVVDMASIKPIDADLILQQAKKTGAIVVAENHSIVGGLSSAVADVLADAGACLPFKRVGVYDRFCEGGSTPYLLKKFGLDSTALIGAVKEVIAKKTLK